MRLIRLINYAINLIYPNCCGICENLSKEDLCKKCETKLNNILKFKVEVYRNKNFEKHIYLFKYEGIIKERLIDFKFNNKSYIYRSITKFIIKNKKICRFLKSYDIIIPVPIHYNRKLERGYNQTALISEDIGKHLNIKYTEKALLKNKNNKPQSSKSKEERKDNVLGVYYVKKPELLKGKKVVLIDDIYTTGNTVDECSKELKRAGVKKILVFTIAKD